MSDNDKDIEAGEWLARLDQEHPDPKDLAEFEQWKKDDPRRSAAFERLAATWQALDRLRAFRPPDAKAIDADYLQTKPHLLEHDGLAVHSTVSPFLSKETTGLDRYRPLRSASQTRRPLLYGIAASVVMAIAGLWVLNRPPGVQTYRTGVGGFQSIVLDDRSVLEMDTDTEVRVELTPTRRKLELVRGEAHFDVAHDVNRPFIVAAGKMAVRAVGTHFDVRKDRNAVEVTVGEGKVVFGAVDVVDAPISIVPPNVISLVAGQSVLADAGNTHLRTLSKQDVDRMLAWRNQLLIFDRDPLSRVVAQFNRYNKRQLVIADPSVAAVEIGGYFHPTNLDAFVGALQSDFGLRVASEGNRLVISAATKR